jgi:hypothetical protein
LVCALPINASRKTYTDTVRLIPFLETILTLKSAISETSEYADEMEACNNKRMILAAEINRIDKENQNLNSMLKRMSTSYNDLQTHIRSLVHKKQQLACVDRSQIFNPDDVREENSNLSILSPRSLDVRSGSAFSHLSYNSSDCREQVREKEGKKAKFMEDQQLPSKKRKINYIQFDQSQNGTINSSVDDNPGAVSQKSYNSSDCPQQVRGKEGKNVKVMDDRLLPSKKRKINYFQLDQTRNGTTVKSSMDDNLICEEPQKKKHNAPSKDSIKQTAVVPKKIVSLRRRSDAPVVILDAEPLFYLRTRA